MYNNTLKACVRVVQPKCPTFGTYNKDEQKCECPVDRPFTDGVECFACDVPNFWNVKTNKCE